MDNRTAKNIETLNPKARPWAKAHIEAIERSGILPSGWTVRIVSANRTWKEQDEIYAQGRTKEGPKVTNARGGQSNHNFGIAWDLGLFDNRGHYVPESVYYEKIVPIGRDLGLEAGHDWKSIQDTPHYQVKTGLSTSELRALMQRGRDIPIPDLDALPPAPARAGVLILENGVETDLPAILHGGRVFVGLRKFIERFGGEIENTNGGITPGCIVSLHGKRLSMPLVIRDGVGFAKFADLNEVLEWGFAYNAGELNLLTEKA